jgi:regulator of sirC expression with transglutaminase-like and TPR domain
MLTFGQLDSVTEQAKKLEALAFVLHEALILSTNDDYHAQAAGLLFHRLNGLHTELKGLLEDIKASYRT